MSWFGAPNERDHELHPNSADQIAEIIKVIAEIITPAIDPSNETAVEQARLITERLELITQSMNSQYRTDRDELEHLVAYARDVSGMGEGNDLLDATIERSSDVLVRARAGPLELINAISDLSLALETPILSMTADDEGQVEEALTRATLNTPQSQVSYATSRVSANGPKAAQADQTD